MKFTTDIFDSFPVKKEPVRGDPRDIKRRDFKPSEIIVLFACESLPHETENFFYYAHSPLYNNTLGAFKKVFPKITQANFFQYFKDLGFYLDDLCGQPINQLKKGNDRKKRIELRKLYEPDFAKRVELYKPQFVIITPMEIKDNIISVLSIAKSKTPFRDLPFPMGNQANKDNYVNGLVDLLKELIEKKIISPVVFD